MSSSAQLAISAVRHTRHTHRTLPGIRCQRPVASSGHFQKGPRTLKTTPDASGEATLDSAQRPVLSRCKTLTMNSASAASGGFRASVRCSLRSCNTHRTLPSVRCTSECFFSTPRTRIAGPRHLGPSRSSSPLNPNTLALTPLSLNTCVRELVCLFSVCKGC